MAGSRFVVTYDALAADIVDTGSGRPASLVVLTAGQQRVIIRMEQRAITRLRGRIELMLRRKRDAARRPSRPGA